MGKIPVEDILPPNDCLMISKNVVEELFCKSNVSFLTKLVHMHLAFQIIEVVVLLTVIGLVYVYRKKLRMLRKQDPETPTV